MSSLPPLKRPACRRRRGNPARPGPRDGQRRTKSGGGGGIRTPGELAPTSDFKSGALNQLSHSSEKAPYAAIWPLKVNRLGRDRAAQQVSIWALALRPPETPVVSACNPRQWLIRYYIRRFPAAPGSPISRKEGVNHYPHPRAARVRGLPASGPSRIHAPVGFACWQGL